MDIILSKGKKEKDDFSLWNWSNGLCMLKLHNFYFDQPIHVSLRRVRLALDVGAMNDTENIVLYPWGYNVFFFNKSLLADFFIFFIENFFL